MYVTPPTGVAEGVGEGRVEDVFVPAATEEEEEEGQNGTEWSSGYVWKNNGAKDVPKNAPSTFWYLLLGGV